MRESQKLTVQAIKALPVESKPYRMRDAVLPGLYVHVSAAGSKTWYVRYRAEGGQHEYKIGDALIIKPATARERARAAVVADAHEKKRTDRAEQKAAISRTLATYLEGDYFEHKLARAKSGKAELSRLMNVWADFLEKDMAAITEAQIRKHCANRLKTVSVQTVARDVRGLRALFNHAIEAKLIAANPVSPGFKWLAKLSGRDKLPRPDRVRYLGQRDEHDEAVISGARDGERARFLKALDGAPDYVRVLVQIALNTGMRRGELFSLTWGMVSLKERQIALPPDITKADEGREVQLNTAAYDVLKAWRGDAIPLRTMLVFPNPDTGERLGSIKRAWAGVVRRADLEDFRLHDCRHDFASRLVLAGVPLNTVRVALGHADISATMIYAHLARSAVSAAVELLS